MENEALQRRIGRLEADLRQINVSIASWEAELRDLEEESSGKVIGANIVSRIKKARDTIASLNTNKQRTERELEGLRR
ncbi:MAG: hypothetical protein V4437_00735 [Patescibacteria group bacterium]